MDKETGWYGFCVLDSETMLRKEMVSEGEKGEGEGCALILAIVC